VPRPCETQPFFDIDPRPGFIAGSVLFGPAQSRPGLVSELGISAYRILFADSCSRQLALSLAETPARVAAPEMACCLGDFYRVDLEATEVPRGATQLLIVAVTEGAERTESGAGGSSLRGAAVPLQDAGSEGATLEPEAEEMLVLAMTLEGVSYPLLASRPTLLSAFEASVRGAIAAEVGSVSEFVTPADVSLELSAGSVRIRATVTFPLGASVGAAQAQLASSTSLGPALASRVAELEGIGEVLTGSIRVESVEVIVSSRNVPYSARPSTSSTVVAVVPSELSAGRLAVLAATCAGLSHL
jgi:hypothetical protein